MKNIKTKIWALLGTTIMLLPFVLSLGTADVSAAVSPTPENVTVNLHKLKFTSAPENQINNGTELTFPNSEPLNGVEFNVYDITATYYPSKDTAVPADATPFASVTTSGEGLANLTLPGKSEGKDAVYVFVETPKPGVETSPNIVLSLPFYNPDSSDPDKPLDTIHLYAKNVIKESNIKIQKAGNFSGVDKLAGAQFQIKNSDNQFVTGFDENTGVALYGPAESALTFTTDSEGSISVNGLLDGNYTLVETKAPDDYQLTDPQKETSFVVENGKLQQTTGIIHGADEADLGNPNGVVNRENTTTDNTITVENVQNYGDFHFIKQDVNTQEKLAGAEFSILRAKDPTVKLMKKIANLASGEYPYAWSDEVTGSDWEEVKLISDSEGEFSIEGLKQGAYCLQETKAPEGYALPKNEAAYTEFTVDDDPTTSDETTIDNQPKGILPSTGGMEIIVFILVGIALVGGTVIYFKKRHQETEA